MTKPAKALTPSSKSFNSYIEEVVRPLLAERCTPIAASRMIDLLKWLEQQRYDFSAGRAFQTRPLSNAAIADIFRVTMRSVRRWFADLEALGLLAREHRKNPRHTYRNLLNRIRFTSFWEWFKAKVASTPDAPCPPKKKDLESKSINGKNSCEEKAMPRFPASGPITYDRYWSDLADQHLPGTRSTRPDRNMIAEKFRVNLNRHAISFDHPSLTARWINFCKAASPIH